MAALPPSSMHPYTLPHSSRPRCLDCSQPKTTADPRKPRPKTHHRVLTKRDQVHHPQSQVHRSEYQRISKSSSYTSTLPLHPVKPQYRQWPRLSKSRSRRRRKHPCLTTVTHCVAPESCSGSQTFTNTANIKSIAVLQLHCLMPQRRRVHPRSPTSATPPPPAPPTSLSAASTRLLAPAPPP